MWWTCGPPYYQVFLNYDIWWRWDCSSWLNYLGMTMGDAWELCESQELSVVSDEEPCGEWPGLKPVARGKKKKGGPWDLWNLTKTVKSYHYGRCWGFVRESLDFVPFGHLLQNPGGGGDLAWNFFGCLQWEPGCPLLEPIVFCVYFKCLRLSARSPIVLEKKNKKVLESKSCFHRPNRTRHKFLNLHWVFLRIHQTLPPGSN